MTISTGNALPLAALSADIPLDAQLAESLNLMADDAALLDESLLAGDFSAMLNEQLAQPADDALLSPDEALGETQTLAQTPLASLFEPIESETPAVDDALAPLAAATNLGLTDEDTATDETGQAEALPLMSERAAEAALASAQALAFADQKIQQARADALEVDADDVVAVLPNLAAMMQPDGETLPLASRTPGMTPLDEIAASTRAPAELAQQPPKPINKAAAPGIDAAAIDDDAALLDPSSLKAGQEKEASEQAQRKTARFDSLLTKNDAAIQPAPLPSDRALNTAAGEFGAVALTQLHNTSSAQTTFNTPLQTLQLTPQATPAQWGDALGEKVSLLISNKLQSAEIRIDPPHLGKLDIQIQLKDDSATINIQTHQAPTRDLIDAASFRLREFLQDSGYGSVDVNVSHRDQSMAQNQNDGDRHPSAGQGERESSSDTVAGLNGLQTPMTARFYQSNGVIDFFA